MSDRVVCLTFDEPSAQRLDKYLAAQLPEFSRTFLQGLIHDGMVTQHGQILEKPGMVLEKGCSIEVRIPPPQPSTLMPEAIPLDIVYEDKDLVVVNKPAGMVVHPAAGHHTGTLVQAILAHAPEIQGVGGEQRPGVVHRLDKDTSGLILMAKNDTAHRWLQDQFSLRRVEKTYLALVDGHPPTPDGRIEAAVGRSSRQPSQMAIVVPQKGREAVSEYKTLETFPQHTLLNVHPITGRTHQIRLHLDFLGCPVAGDRVYGHKKSSIPLERHFLHAYRLTIQLRAGEGQRTFEAPIPPDLVQVLQWLRSGYK